MPYALLADAVLVLHVAVVAFVVAGLAAIVAGNLLGRGQALVNAPLFRIAHLAAIATVAAQAWAGVVCPLTTLEMWLRARSGASVYAGGFIEHWLQAVLYYDLPGWVFTSAYTLFGLAVLGAWWRWPPRRHNGGPQSATH